MAVPKRRTSRSKRDMRRQQHDKVAAPTLVACANCGEPSVPHRACASCGWYKGRMVRALSSSSGSGSGSRGSAGSK